MRTPGWAIVLILLVIIGLGVYGYFTTPLPFGLNALIRTPGGSGGAAPSATPVTTQRTAAGQPLGLGLVTLNVQGVQRNVDLSSGGRDGPTSAFTVLLVQLVNAGSESIGPLPNQFRLQDERGRTYAVDVEATRIASQTNRRRAPFEATVPPGGRLETTLAFDVPSDATALTLRVNLGFGELELPR